MWNNKGWTAFRCQVPIPNRGRMGLHGPGHEAALRICAASFLLVHTPHNQCTFSQCNRDVGLACESGHLRCNSSCPLWANSGRLQGTDIALLSREFCQCELGLVQWARYAIAAIESGLLSTINASSSFTRYKKGLSPVVSLDFFLPLT
jgi:hypothetical protein